MEHPIADVAEKDPIELLACLQPYPAEEMGACAVADLVSSVRNQGPELTEPPTAPRATSLPGPAGPQPPRAAGVPRHVVSGSLP